jgi:hypothetical protein
VANRNFLSFGFRQWDRTDAAIALAFEQKAWMILIRFLCGANGISDALSYFRDIRLPERGHGNGMPIAIDGNGFEGGVL